MIDMDIFVHPSSYIDDGCSIDKGTKIWHFSHVMSGAQIGKNCLIGEHVFIETGVRLGNNVKVKNNIALYNGVVCEDYVFLGPACIFTNVINPRSNINRKKEFKETLLKKGSTIGAGAVIICGNTIGKYAFVGAGSVVTKDVSDYSLVVGNPAKFLGYVCKCNTQIQFIEGHAHCSICGAEYLIEDGKVKEK